MESDHEKSEPERKPEKKKEEINIAHDDLSDVSDLDDSIGASTEDEALRDKDEEKEKEDKEEAKAEVRNTSLINKI